MILIRQLFSAFATQNTISEQENQCKIMRFEFRFLETHHSNWGKAPKFKSIRSVYIINLAKNVSGIVTVVKTTLFGLKQDSQLKILIIFILCLRFGFFMIKPTGVIELDSEMEVSCLG
jgi:hypothetical protein